jgi:hypothetical protein
MIPRGCPKRDEESAHFEKQLEYQKKSNASG